MWIKSNKFTNKQITVEVLIYLFQIQKKTYKILYARKIAYNRNICISFCFISLIKILKLCHMCQKTIHVYSEHKWAYDTHIFWWFTTADEDVSLYLHKCRVLFNRFSLSTVLCFPHQRPKILCYKTFLRY